MYTGTGKCTVNCFTFYVPKVGGLKKKKPASCLCILPYAFNKWFFLLHLYGFCFAFKAQPECCERGRLCQMNPPNSTARPVCVTLGSAWEAVSGEEPAAPRSGTPDWPVPTQGRGQDATCSMAKVNACSCGCGVPAEPSAPEGIFFRGFIPCSTRV